MTNAEFADIYWASKHPDVRKLRDMERMSAGRTSAALELVKAGFTIDPVIDLGRWDALAAMQAREFYGFTWVPALGQEEIKVMPGIVFPGFTYDPENPPSGSIKVTYDPKDFPPFEKPVPPPPPIELPDVGSYIGGGFYNSNDRAKADGTVISWDGKKLRKMVYPTFPPGTFTHFWKVIG